MMVIPIVIGALGTATKELEDPEFEDEERLFK